MKKIEDIEYSGRVFTKRVTGGATDYYFLVVDLDLRAKSFPSNNIPIGKPHHVFELPISEQKYEELREQLSSSRGFLRLAEGTFSLSQDKGLESNLVVNKAYLSAQRDADQEMTDEEYIKRAKRDLPGLINLGIKVVEEGSPAYDPDEDLHMP